MTSLQSVYTLCLILGVYLNPVVAELHAEEPRDRDKTEVQVLPWRERIRSFFHPSNCFSQGSQIYTSQENQQSELENPLYRQLVEGLYDMKEEKERLYTNVSENEQENKRVRFMDVLYGTFDMLC